MDADSVKCLGYSLGNDRIIVFGSECEEALPYIPSMVHLSVSMLSGIVRYTSTT